MGQPFVGEIRMFGGNYAPAGWMLCQGQLLPISEYETLYALIGTTYGGDGQNTFQLPNLQGRAPMHMGTGAGTTVNIGEIGGTETVALTMQQIPSHSHHMLAIGTASSKSPKNALLAVASSDTVGGLEPYQPTGGALTTLNNSMLQPTGGNQPHENMQPFLCVSFIISLFGIFPSQS